MPAAAAVPVNSSPTTLAASSTDAEQSLHDTLGVERMTFAHAQQAVDESVVRALRETNDTLQGLSGAACPVRTPAGYLGRAPDAVIYGVNGGWG